MPQYLMTESWSRLSQTSILRKQPLRGVPWNYLFPNIKSIVRNYLKFYQNPSKIPVQEFIFNKVAGRQPATLLNNELLQRYFSRIMLTIQKHIFQRTPFSGCFQTFLSRYIINHELILLYNLRSPNSLLFLKI